MASFKKFLLECYKIFIDCTLILYFLAQKSFNNKEFVFITGSDSTHFNSLINLLNSLTKHEPCTEVVVVNLGMKKEEIMFIKKEFKYTVKDFKFDESISL